MARPFRPRLAHALVWLLPVATVAACGDSGKTSAKAGDEKTSAAACQKSTPSAVYVAYKEYIKAALPTPQRFLTAAGTDSAAAEDGFRAMQDKGPSYFYGGDSVAKQKIREKLASVGPYASLLIVQRANATSPNGDTVTLRLGGHYIGGEHEGKVATSRTMIVVCADTAWKVASQTEEAAK